MTPDDSNIEDGKYLSSYSNIFETSSVIFLAANSMDMAMALLRKITHIRDGQNGL
jgi:hypothetical protein